VTSRCQQVLVTGASGFLGSEIVARALEGGWRVRALVRSPRVQFKGAEIFEGDITDSVLLRKVCEGVSAVVHVAGLAHVFGPGARDDARFNLVNEVGTGNVVDAAVESGVSQVVLVSSVAVYGGYSGGKCDETVPCHPQGAYAVSKWRGEVMAAERIAKGRGSLDILRFATIYGEGDRGNVAKLVRALNTGRFIWPGSGLNKKSLIYKADAARACLCALSRPRAGVEVFNVSAQPSTMREIVSAICRALDRPSPSFGVPSALVNVVASMSRALGDPGQLSQLLAKFIRDDVYDVSKFEAAVGFRPEVSLSEGIQREVQFLVSRATGLRNSSEGF
jgi:nucleoside-diphosphate-sugar epimerase